MHPSDLTSRYVAQRDPLHGATGHAPSEKGVPVSERCCRCRKRNSHIRHPAACDCRLCERLVCQHPVLEVAATRGSYGSLPQLPELRQDFGTGKRAILGGGPESNASANVRVNLGCPTEGLPRHDAAQVTIGGCGEARDGTGARFFRSGLQQFDFYAGGAPDLGYCY